MNNKKYIITGGPGVGKTTLINKLASLGFLTISEDARQIIKEEMEIEGEGLPWKNKLLYACLMLQASINSYQKALSISTEKSIFFDRGIPDALCYFKMENLRILEEDKRFSEALKYNQLVFILPPWDEIYKTDKERKQTWEEAKKTFFEMKKTYESLGYKVVEVPRETVENRVKFVLKTIQNSK